MTSLPARVAKPRLPQTYEAARAALEKCVRIDECAEYADKAKALAVYALQSKDESLYKMAIRIRARAIRRTGELLREIEPQKGGQSFHVSKGWTHCGWCGRRFKPSENTQHLCSTRVGTDPSRKHAADAAGLSARQRKTALRVAKVPPCDFDQLVESDSPPTIPKLAAMGTTTWPTPKRSREEAEAFSISTEGQAAVGVLHRATKRIDLILVVKGATKRERASLIAQSRDCMIWLRKLVNHCRRANR